MVSKVPDLAISNEVLSWFLGSVLLAILYHLYLTIWSLDCATVFQVHRCVSCIEWLSSCSQVNYKIHNVQVVTFGQPRVGNTAFASRYSKLVPNTIRVTNKHDIVPHLPPYYPRLTQKTYHHFPREVIFSVHILNWFLQPFARFLSS